MVLKFDSAKLFPYVSDSKFKPNSDSYQHSNNTLFWSHVSNPLHVLCGLRPTKTFKPNNYQINSTISKKLVDIAKSSKVKINSAVEYLDAKNNTRYINEIFSGNKFLGDSNVKASTHFIGMKMKLFVNQKIKTLNNTKTKDNPNKKLERKNITFDEKDYVLEDVLTETPNISWSRFRHHVNNPVYNSFVEMVKQLIPNCFNVEFKKIIEVLNREYYTQNKLVVDFFDVCYHNSDCLEYKIPTTYYNIICNGKVSDQFIHQSGYNNLFPYYKELVTHKPEQIVNLNGEIIVKIDSEILDHIVRTSCTILDGGVLQISKIVDEYEFDTSILETYNNIKLEKEYV